MSNSQINAIRTTQEIHPHRNTFLSKFGTGLLRWEIYPILALAIFLRFYQLPTTEFDADQAIIFRMARDAITHGLIPATSNLASIRIVNPPAVVYLLMIPAAVSANPIGGAVFVALLSILAVLLTYIFVNRYYGRFPAITASLLYVTAAEPLHFSRFIWQQNMIAPFVMLFMFALFWGVVERRKGWLVLALVVLGGLVQLHETTIILSLLLLIALLLSPGTVRLRDLTLGLIFLLLLFSTYLLWEFSIAFGDLHLLFQLSKLRSNIDLTALNYYELFLNPYSNTPTSAHTLLYQLVPFLHWLPPVMLVLLLSGLLVIAALVVFSPPIWKKIGSVHEESRNPRSLFLNLWQSFGVLWADFRAAPHRCGYFLLLSWQIVPVLILSRHSEPVFPYYLLMVLPGPFIIIAILFSKLEDWLPRQGGMWNIAHKVIYVIAGLIIATQLLGSTAVLIDEATGNNPHGYSYNTLNSLEDALNEADQVSLLHHLNHVYIATDQYTQTSLRYLAEQMHTPTTLFDASRCLVLPDATAGPAMLLVGPSDTLSMILLSHFANASLVSQPVRLGGLPFHLFIVRSTDVSMPASFDNAFVDHLQLLDRRIQRFRFENSSWLATRWRFIRSAPTIYRTTYTYNIKAQYGSHSDSNSQCIFTSIRAGDQLVVASPLFKSFVLPSALTISAKAYTTIPFEVTFGLFHLETIRDQNTQLVFLQTTDGKSVISVSST